MAKTLLYRLFGLGKIPERLIAALKREGIILLDEGVRGSTTYRNFRSPTRYSKWRREWHSASVIITEARLLALRYSSPIIDVPFKDERLRQMQSSLEESDTLRVAFDASLFHNDWSGAIEYRFRTPQAQLFLDAIRERAFGTPARRG